MTSDQRDFYRAALVGKRDRPYARRRSTSEVMQMSSSTLFRASGLAGIVCGLVILLQRLVFDTLGPGSPVAIGPLGPVLGLLVLTGAYLRQREESGVLGGVAYLVSFLSMGFIAGVDFTRRYILVQLPPEVVSELFAGPTRLLFLAC